MPIPRITAEHFYKFFQCPHWIWYDIYADAKHKRAMPPLLDMIYRGKVSDAGSALMPHKQFEEIKPELFRDLEEGFMATLELMRQGKNIYHGVLMHTDWAGIPDLLEARPGKSKLGDWHYVAYDVQSSLDLRDEYKFPLVFYSLILEQIQGVRPKEAYVIDPQGEEKSFLVDDFTDRFDLTHKEIEKVLEGEKPAPFLKAGCRRTPWYSLCLSGTQECNDVSLVYRLSQGDQKRLYDAGIKTVNDLAAMDVNELQGRLEDWPFDKIIRFSNQANVLVSGQPLITRKPDFPNVATEVYFDIESDPTHDVDYLLGALIKNTKSGETEYKSFLARNKGGEKKMWQDFLDFLAGLEDFVIYHYAFYEKQVFDRLALKYGAPSELTDKFRTNTIDLHLKLVDSAVLPLYFYTLKDVGRYLGYEWSDPNAGGAESIVWFNDWITKGEQETLDKIVRYNEDDVRATLLVKEWLAGQKPTKRKEKLEEESP